MNATHLQFTPNGVDVTIDYADESGRFVVKRHFDNSAEAFEFIERIEAILRDVLKPQVHTRSTFQDVPAHEPQLAGSKQ